jgi:hypothetical protein
LRDAASFISAVPKPIPFRAVRPPPRGGLRDRGRPDPQHRTQPRRRVTEHLQRKIRDPLPGPTDRGAPTPLLQCGRGEVYGWTHAGDKRLQRDHGPARRGSRREVALEGLHLHVNGPWCITFEWIDGEALRVNLEQYH